MKNYVLYKNFLNFCYYIELGVFTFNDLHLKRFLFFNYPKLALFFNYLKLGTLESTSKTLFFVLRNVKQGFFQFEK